jgi:hypothetical protein
MTNRFERRTARNTKAAVRIARWNAERQARMDALALAELRKTVRAQHALLALTKPIPPRPDLEP